MTSFRPPATLSAEVFFGVVHCASLMLIVIFISVMPDKLFKCKHTEKNTDYSNC